MICLSDHSLATYPQRNAFFLLGHDGTVMRKGAIYGKTDAAIAETAAFFWSLQYAGERDTYLDFRHSGAFSFNYAALQPEQLHRILNAQPKRLVEIQTGIWNGEQSVALATCPSPLHLRFSTTSTRMGGFSFHDKGTAFVTALEHRSTPFGSLYMDFEPNDVPFNAENLQRLVQLENKFEKIAFFLMKKELVLLPFSAKVNALEYQWEAKSVRPNDFHSLHIPAKDLVINIFLDGVKDWDQVVLSFLTRMAQLGHFEKLDLNLDYEDERYLGQLERHDASLLTDALIRLIHGNPSLKHLDVGGMHMIWTMRDILKALEDHQGIRTFVVKSFPREDPNYIWLKQLISRNQNIIVSDLAGNRYTAAPGLVLN